MENATNSIEKQFEGSTLTKLQITTLVEWLQNTPKTSTIRINLLRTTVNKVRIHIENTFKQCKYLPSSVSIENFDEIPEMILIRNIDETSNCPGPRLRSKEVIVDVSCGAAVLRGAHIYGPGVIAMESNTKIDEIVNIFVDMEGKCKKGTNIVYESSSKKFIGIGQIKMQRFSLFAHDVCSRGIAVQVHQTISCVPSIGCDFLEGQYGILQNFPSIVCSKVLDPKPNEIVLDMCAAPGNKTTHLAQLMEDNGLLIALDKSENRVSVLKENIRKFELNCVRCYNFDAAKAITNEEKKNNDLSPPFMEQTFDKILLDAPCSGLGNRPILLTKMNRKIRESFPKIQKKLLETAYRLLKIGGILVFSTCSVLEQENELNVAWFMQKYSEKIQLETASPLFGSTGLPNTGLSDTQRTMVQRFGPCLDENDKRNTPIDSTGFFISKFRKIA